LGIGNSLQMCEEVYGIEQSMTLITPKEFMCNNLKTFETIGDI
jgi:hypothetical protein